MYRMTTSDSLTYVIDFRDDSNCSRIESAEPGQAIPLAKPILAKGTLSHNSRW